MLRLIRVQHNVDSEAVRSEHVQQKTWRENALCRNICAYWRKLIHCSDDTANSSINDENKKFWLKAANIPQDSVGRMAGCETGLKKLD